MTYSFADTFMRVSQTDQRFLNKTQGKNVNRIYKINANVE